MKYFIKKTLNLIIKNVIINHLKFLKGVVLKKDKVYFIMVIKNAR